MSRDFSSEVSSVTFLNGINSSILSPDSSLLFLDEGSETKESIDYLDESLPYLSAESDEEKSNTCSFFEFQVEMDLSEDEESLNYGNQHTLIVPSHAQHQNGAESQQDSSLLLSESTLNDSLQTNLSCNSPLSTDNYLIIDSPVNHSTPHIEYWHKQKNLQGCTAQSPIPSRMSADQSCCKRKCLTNLSSAEIDRCQKRFCSRTTSEQNQFLLDSFF